MLRIIQGFFNEILSSIQRFIFEEENFPNDNENKYYHLPLDEYFSMGMKIARELRLSPKEIYDTWSLPMLIVTYVDLHNNSVTNYGFQQEQMKNKKPLPVHYEENYIINITPEMIIEGLAKEKEQHEFTPEHEMLKALYERK